MEQKHWRCDVIFRDPNMTRVTAPTAEDAAKEFVDRSISWSGQFEDDLQVRVWGYEPHDEPQYFRCTVEYKISTKEIDESELV